MRQTSGGECRSSETLFVECLKVFEGVQRDASEVIVLPVGRF